LKKEWKKKLKKEWKKEIEKRKGKKKLKKEGKEGEAPTEKKMNNNRVNKRRKIQEK